MRRPRTASGGHLSTVEDLDPQGNNDQGTWRGVGTIAQLPERRGFPGVAAVSNGRIYVVGGGNTALLNTVQEYDPVSNSWSAVASMAVGLDTLAAAVVTVGGQERLYAVGGENNSGAGGSLLALNRVEYLPLAASGHATGTWSGTRGVPQMPWPRLMPAVVARLGKLWVLGGAVGARGASSPSPSSAVFELDVAANVWSETPGQTYRPTMPTGRFGLGAAVVGR